MRNFLREYKTPFIISSIGVLFSYTLHTKRGFWSPLRLSDKAWSESVYQHLVIYPFSIRPFQTHATIWFHKLTTLPIKDSFFLIQFSLALILGLVFFAYLKRLDFDRFWSLIGLVVLYLAYPVFGAHYAPTHTWDDFWGYLFITLSLLFLLRKQPIVSGLFITAAVIAREQNAVFLPVILLGVWWLRREVGTVRTVIGLVVPIVISVGYRLAVAEFQDVNRLTFLALLNFLDLRHSVDTFCSFIIAFGYLWLLSFVGLYIVLKDWTAHYGRLLSIGLMITLPTTIALTIFASLARETRIFFPPFVFVIPLALLATSRWVDFIRDRWSRKRLIVMSSIFVLLSVVGGFFPGRWLHAHFNYSANSELRGPLTGVYLAEFVAIAVIYLLECIRPSHPGTLKRVDGQVRPTPDSR